MSSDTYPKPHLGQVFFRHPQHDRTQRDFAMCAGLEELGTVHGQEQWRAVLSDGRGGTDQITYQSRCGSASWMPLPAEERETRYGPGYVALKEENEQLRAALDAFGERFNEVVGNLSTRLAALEKPQARKEEPPPAVEPVVARPPVRRVAENTAPR